MVGGPAASTGVASIVPGSSGVASSSDAPSSAGASSSSAPSTGHGPASSSSLTVERRAPRKLNRSANQLHRNQACLPCRRRRIKCDAGRPHCSSCVRSFRFLARTQPDPERDARGVQCFYEGDPQGSIDLGDTDVRSLLEDDPRGAAPALETRIAEMHGSLGQQHITSPGASTAGTLQHTPRQPPVFHHQTAGQSMGWSSVDPSATHQHYPVQTPPSGHHSTPSFTGDFTAIASGSHGHTIQSPVSSTAPSWPVHGMAPVAQPDPHGHPPPMFNEGIQVEDPMAPYVEMAMGGMSSAMQPMPLANPPPAPPHTADAATLPRGTPPYPPHVTGHGDPRPATAPEPTNRVGVMRPGWRPQLPAPEIMEHIVHAFFNVVPSVPRILHRQSLVQRLNLSPTLQAFPHPALLHAICALTARYTNTGQTPSVDEYLRQQADESVANRTLPIGMSLDDFAATESSFADRHAEYALFETRYGSANVGSRLEVAQAQTLLAYYYLQNGKWLQSWQLAGQVVRLVGPLALTREAFSGSRNIEVLLPSAPHDVEREERRLLVAYIMQLDYAATQSPEWTFSLDPDEVMGRLPASQPDFDRGGSIPEDLQLWHTPDLYTKFVVALTEGADVALGAQQQSTDFFSHPLVDPFVVYSKGVHLLGQVLKSVRRSASIEDMHMPRNTQMLGQLEQSLDRYQASLVGKLPDPFAVASSGMHKPIDADLINAYILPNIIRIKLHEHHIQFLPHPNESTTRAMGACREVLRHVYSLMNKGYDFSFIMSAVTSSGYLFVVATILAKSYRATLEAHDLPLAAVHLQEMDVLRVAFSSMGSRFPLAVRHNSMLQGMLQSAHDDLKIAPEAVRKSGLNPD